MSTENENQPLVNQQQEGNCPTEQEAQAREDAAMLEEPTIAGPSKRKMVLDALKQQGLCVFMVFLICYEVLGKSKARAWYNTPEGRASGQQMYDFSSVQFINGSMSVVLGLLYAVLYKDCNGKSLMWQIFNEDFGAENWNPFNPCIIKMQGWFIPPALLFSLSQSLGALCQADVFFPPDVAKVIDQSRLLMLSLVSIAIFGQGRMPSRATWGSLITITFAACIYTVTKQQTAEISKLSKGGASGVVRDDYNYFAGFLLCMLNCMVMCIASVVAEKFLKDFKKYDFPIQKICLELPTLPWLPFYAAYLDPLIQGAIYTMAGAADKWAQIERKRASKVTPSFWSECFTTQNGWLLVLIFTFCMKSYCNGIIAKQMSSVVKQICQVTSTAALLFLQAFHDPKDSVFDIAPAMIIADFLVFVAVYQYSLSTRDKTRKKMYKKERDAAQEKLAKYESV